MINYLTHKEIDREKWDNCISGSANEFIYAYSWYLDIVSPGWDALIKGDYSTVMPLTWKRKAGISYLFKPIFAQQLGIFSATQVDNSLVKEFINTIPAKFRFIQISLNEHNPSDDLPADITMYSNYELSLARPYEEIYDSYSRNCKRNIKKAVEAGLTVTRNVSISQFTEFLKLNLGKRITELRRKNYEILKSILITSTKYNTGKIFGVITREKELCAIGYFMYSSKRCIFSVCASSEQGKSFQAMYLLVNNEIKNNSGKNMIFDFSGSNIKGIAYFNSTFGAEPVEYPVIYRNNLPWFIKFVK
jgi:hypothetical protein